MNLGRRMTFGAGLLALATAFPLACGVDAPEPSTGAVEQRAVSKLPSNLNLVLNSKNNVTIGDLAGITGDVGSTAAAGQVVFGVSATQKPADNVLAYSVNVNVGASVGNVFADAITLNGTDASSVLGLDPSTLPPVPSATTAVPGATSITVPTNHLKEICAGQYGAVAVGAGSTLNLNGGVYHMSKLTLAGGAKLQPSEPVVILVAGDVIIETGAVVGPYPVLVNPMSAADIRFEVGGNVTIGPSSNVTAHILAPNGKLSTGKAATLTGAGWASVINIGESSVVQVQGTFSSVTPSVPPACNDNNDCTVDQCVGGGTSSGFCQNTVAPDGTTCQSDGVCQGGACCAPGFANCDGNAANGCETNLLTDNNNCNGCGNVCPTNWSCDNGTCVVSPTLVGSYTLGQGPFWFNNPPTETCQQACAIVFGGVAAQYSCSTTSAMVTHTNWEDGFANTSHCPGGTPVAETYDLNTNYDCGFSGCSFSAYVSDNCPFATNYCFH